MSILEKLIEVRSEFIENDRIQAMKALIKKLYYDVAPIVVSGDTLTIFNNDCDIDCFCRENKIDIRAMNWLIESMCNENLLMRGKMSVILTSLGVEKLCKTTII